VGAPGGRLQSISSREYPDRNGGASSRRDIPRASAAAPMSRAMCRPRSRGGRPRPA
jgi:hypothetical protein